MSFLFVIYKKKSFYEAHRQEITICRIGYVRDTNAGVTKALMSIKGMNTNFRKNRMSNARIQQIVTLLYMHKEIVTSEGVHEKESKGLQDVLTRAFKNNDYYKNNPMLKGTFDFLKLVVDSWYTHG